LRVLCVFAAPAVGASVDYTFTVTSGTLSVDTSPDGIATPDPVTVNLAGTFMATIDQSDCHIGASDMITLGDALLANTQTVHLTLMGLATADILPGSAKFVGFSQPAPAHIGPGGVGALETDAEFEATMFVTGLLTTTFSTSAPAGTLLPFTFTISTSVVESQTVQLALNGIFTYEIGVAEIGQTLTLDLIIDIVGTAHVVPDPAFGGLTALGLAGAGAWLRRRS
jgi:MYXO-CTERM domain-containing protein